MLKRLKKQIKSSDGSLDIFSFITGVIISIFLICMLLDLMRLGWQFNGISQLNTQIARTASIQGGVLNTAPRDYPGNYVTVADLSDIVYERVKSLVGENEANEPGKYSISIIDNTSDTPIITGNGNYIASKVYDYKDPFTTKVTLTYEWKFLNAISPLRLGNQSISSTRPAMSEWKYNYGTWDGE